MVYGEMHYHKKYFKGGLSESVQNQVHTIDYLVSELHQRFF